MGLREVVDDRRELPSVAARVGSSDGWLDRGAMGECEAGGGESDTATGSCVWATRARQGPIESLFRNNENPFRTVIHRGTHNFAKV